MHPKTYITIDPETGIKILNHEWSEEKFFCEAGEFVSGRIYDYEYELILN